jgi:hypothetical protein
MLEGSLIIWLLVALATAFLAARKNRSFIGWLVIGLVIPVVGLILILVLPEKTAVEAKSTAA